MAITTASEFEAVMGQAMIKVDKVLYQRADPPNLNEARRNLEKVLSFSREPDKLKQQSATLNAAIEVVSKEIADDEKLRNDLWDCSDYIDFGC
jgi:hypothetical protein